MSAADLPEPCLEDRFCESCGEAFGCGARTDACWCSSVPVDPSVREEFAARYRDCLCPRCLRAAAATEGP